MFNQCVRKVLSNFIKKYKERNFFNKTYYANKIEKKNSVRQFLNKTKKKKRLFLQIAIFDERNLYTVERILQTKDFFSVF